jgi:hypothetical protein
MDASKRSCSKTYRSCRSDGDVVREIVDWVRRASLGVAMKLTGHRVGRWKILRFVGGPHYSWRCRCRCGAVKNVPQGNLVRRLSLSCGCRRAEVTGRRSRTHRQSGTDLHRIWSGILVRVRAKSSKERADWLWYSRLGVSRRWLKFENFARDMGPRPSPRHSIDRKNNKLGYSKRNCRWATPKQQARNRRSSRFVRAFGLRLTVAEWSERTGIKYGTLLTRLNMGMSPRKAVTP